MSIHLAWYTSDETAFYIRYAVGWTWAQHHQVVDTILQMTQAKGLNFSLCLFDLRGTTIPFDSPTGGHYRDPRHESFVIIVMDHVFSRTIVQLLIRARGHQHLVQIVNTLEEGEALLNQKIAQRYHMHKR
ncbi:hypothetical protein HC776_01620 [bacterium]|nr:hypothetical protein [bacterium]